MFTRQRRVAHFRLAVLVAEGSAIVIGVDLVEASPAESHIPVRQIVVDKFDDRARRRRRVVILERGIDRLLQSLEAAEHPPINDWARRERGIFVRR